MLVAIIDYGSGNLRSASRAVMRAADECGIDAQVLVTNNARDLTNAERIILPGQGAFGDCMAGLKALPGMIETMSECILIQQKPFLGICVGMQLLAARGLEHGQHDGLGWIAGSVVPLAAGNLKIPHMGWNTLEVAQAEHPLMDGISTGDHVYFVHSFKFDCTENENIVASSSYGENFAAIIAKGNITGMQFHPEKSQKTGLQLMRNFLQWGS